MLVIGFPTKGTSWSFNPLSEDSPESIISPACHIYRSGEGWVVGIDTSLGMSEKEMFGLLESWSKEVNRYVVNDQ